MCSIDHSFIENLQGDPVRTYPRTYMSGSPSIWRKSSRLRLLLGGLPPTFHVPTNTLQRNAINLTKISLFFQTKSSDEN